MALCRERFDANLFKAWLAWPVVAVFASLFAFYLGAAVLLVWLSYRSKLAPWIQSFRGVVPPVFVPPGPIKDVLRQVPA